MRLGALRHRCRRPFLAVGAAAQQRLCRRFRTLGTRKDSRNVVAAAIPRELASFVWAEMTA